MIDRRAPYHIPTDVLDWMHFGQVTQPGAGMDTEKETGTFMADRKKGGVGLTMPKNGTGGHLTVGAQAIPTEEFQGCF